METKNPLKEPIVIPRSEHSVSRASISPNALKVLYRLRASGFRACLVGGGVRDLLLGREPKDFDVGTDAHPEEVKGLFRNCRLIGRRFRLAHVQFGREIIEVATFRAGGGAEDAADAEEEELDAVGDLPEDDGEPDDADFDDGPDGIGPLRSDNVYGSIEEDAWRRDFTINALYYDIADFSVLDYADGMSDLQAGLIRLIGVPAQRYREDPVRMLRAVRFAAKLGFRIHPDTEAPIHRLAHLLEDVPPARLFDEVLKLLQGGSAVQTFELLRLYGLFGQLFPLTEGCLRRQSHGFPRTLVIRALANTDRRIQAGKPVTPAFLYAALLWEPLQERMRYLCSHGMDEQRALAVAAEQVIQSQVHHTALPKRFSIPMREIWELQSRFAQRSHKRAERFLAHPRFRAAYDFLLLRSESGEDLQELADWWTRIQEEISVPLPNNIEPGAERRPGRRRRRRAGTGESG